MIMYIYVCIRLYAYIYVDERRGKKKLFWKSDFDWTRRNACSMVSLFRKSLHLRPSTWAGNGCG